MIRQSSGTQAECTFGWRLLLPVSVLNLLATGLLILLCDGAGESVGAALAWLGDVSQAVVAVAAALAMAALLHYWLRPARKSRDPATSAVRAAAALGGTRAARMGA